MKKPLFLTVLALFSLNLWAQAPDANLSLPESIIALPEAAHVLLVEKTKKTLYLYKKENKEIKLLLSYPTDIGKDIGEKLKANDYRTPTGIYFFLRQLSPPAIPYKLYGDLAFTTDYPNIFDKLNLKTGSGIWLHAVPDTVSLERGSRGCVVVRNQTIKELKNYIELNKTPIVISDEIKFLNPDDYQKNQEAYLSAIEKWRTAWETQDIESYMKYYSPQFHGSKMTYDQWYRHKKYLKEKYKYIKVAIKDLLVLKKQNELVFRFKQNYESDLHKDEGDKVIYAQLSPEGTFSIIKEDWFEPAE